MNSFQFNLNNFWTCSKQIFGYAFIIICNFPVAGVIDTFFSTDVPFLLVHEVIYLTQSGSCNLIIRVYDTFFVIQDEKVRVKWHYACPFVKFPMYIVFTSITLHTVIGLKESFTWSFRNQNTILQAELCLGLRSVY